MPDFTLRPHKDHWIGTYAAMASTCEIIIDNSEQELAQKLTQIAQQETLRIQQKFSRYQKDNLLWQINHANGAAVNVDSETAHLLDFADQCFQLSDGYFDITSGCLRRAWTFDGSDKLPSEESVNALLPFVGWQKVSWKKGSRQKQRDENSQLQMPAGMEIDFGGIGKEYAADKALLLLTQATQGQTAAFLVNFGGDIAASGPRSNGSHWQVGLAHGDQVRNIPLVTGGIATSGDSHRFIWHNGVKLSHILNPLTGWPVSGGPSTATVFAQNCTQAGMLATFALLHGSAAEDFLQQQGCSYILT